MIHEFILMKFHELPGRNIRYTSTAVFLIEIRFVYVQSTVDKRPFTVRLQLFMEQRKLSLELLQIEYNGAGAAERREAKWGS